MLLINMSLISKLLGRNSVETSRMHTVNRKHMTSAINTMVVALSSLFPSYVSADWITTLDVDIFTDEVACEIIAVDSYNSVLGMGERKHVTQTGALYPLIRYKNGSLSVGVKAGGTIPLPPGDIDFRVDRNKAWKIKSIETPKDLVTEIDVPSMPVLQLPNLTEQQQKAYEDSLAQTMQSIKDLTAYSSTYTMASGDKAQKIIAEMLQGDRLIYRSSTQVNMGIELSGFADLGDPFISKVRECLPELVSKTSDVGESDS